MIEEHFPSVVTRPIHHFANLYRTTPICPDNNWGTTASNKHCTATSTGHWGSTRTTKQTTVQYTHVSEYSTRQLS